MNTVRFTPAAASDLSDIWDYTAANWGIVQADRYTDDFQRVCEALASGEMSGRRVDVRDGYLKYPVGRHLIFFVRRASGIEVVRILHERMDAARHF